MNAPRRARWAAAGAAAAGLAGGALLWSFVVSPWRQDRHWLYAARTALRSLAELEQVCCFHTGRYTGDLGTLSSFADRPGAVLALREEVFAPGSLELDVSADRATLRARARDRKGTELAFEARRPAARQ